MVDITIDKWLINQLMIGGYHYVVVTGGSIMTDDS